MSAQNKKKANKINGKPAARSAVSKTLDRSKGVGGKGSPQPQRERPGRPGGGGVGTKNAALAKSKLSPKPKSKVAAKQSVSKLPPPKSTPAAHRSADRARGVVPAKGASSAPQKPVGKSSRPASTVASRKPPPPKPSKPAPKVKKANHSTGPVVSKEKALKVAAREREQVRREREREREEARREREREAARRAKAQEATKRERERLAKLKLQEAEKKRKELEERKAEQRKAAERLAKQQQQARLQAQKEEARLAQQAAREEERRRQKAEREAEKIAQEEERARQKAQKEAEREELRRQREEERARRDAEREAYRKAKEAEREKIRAAREAARRALEGRIAEANRSANKLGPGRGATSRIYSPGAIPNQSGTTRRTQQTFIGVSQVVPDLTTPPVVTPGPEVPGSTPPTDAAAAEEAARLAAASERPLPTAENIEERYRAIEERLKSASEPFRRDYQETLDMSWIHHDSALEGVVYTFQELKTAIDSVGSVVTDSSLQPVVEEIRRHKAAIELVRDLGERKRAPITVDIIKKIYLTLHPEEGDIKTVKYRRDIPQHRLYFHEYCHPEKIPQKLRQIVDWLNGPEPKKLKSPIRVAARAHYELLRVFPFQTDSGKVSRLLMNLLLLRAGHPPALIHSTERQRYYESIKGALPILVQMVTESILNALVSIEKLLDEHEAKRRAPSVGAP